MHKEGYGFRKPHSPSAGHYLKLTLKLTFLVFCSLLLVEWQIQLTHVVSKELVL